MNTKPISLAVVGATGLVGKTVRDVLEEKQLPIFEYHFLASHRSSGRKFIFQGQEYMVEELSPESFTNTHFDYAIFCAGSDISKQYAPIATHSGCVVVDNSSAFRMDPSVPLVVPEVNPDALLYHNGIIANPNCSTIQAVVALKPLDDKYKIKRIVYSTYQAVSGAGQKGLEDFHNTQRGFPANKFPYPIYNNCLPHIDVFLKNGYTKEEEKMIQETRKILNRPDLKVTATTVRVPVENCHSESINIELEKSYVLEELIDLLSCSSGIVVQNNVSALEYPIATHTSGHDDVFVGRIRRDDSIENGVNLWVVADNIRKGAATNAVQILEKLLQ